MNRFDRWVAAAETRLDHFEALCGGDRELARELLPFMMKHKDDLKDIETLSGAWTVFLESYVTLLAGMAPTFEVMGGRRVRHPVLEGIRREMPEIWCEPPFDAQVDRFHVSNQRLQMYEQVQRKVALTDKTPVTRAKFAAW